MSMSLHEVFQFATGLSERLSLGGLVPLLFLAAVLIISVVIAALILLEKHSNLIMPGTVQAYLTFFYGSFLKPHTGDKNGDQQEALESFYKTQAGAYDITRTRLLRGREEMIRLTAAQLKQKEFARKPVWVDIGGGTGWNIERMGNYLPVTEFFRAVYLVDLSPSLGEIAKARFQKLGWKNVKIVNQDARYFRLEDHEGPYDERSKETYVDGNAGRVELITMSYSLSMIPEYYPIIESMTSLLSINGIISVVDFYAQNQLDYRNRNYIGGVLGRHCNWFNRTFWRLWFEFDRVHLDAARRDYLEFRFGTKLSVNLRNNMVPFARIPHYIWIGCSKDISSLEEQLTILDDAAATKSLLLQAKPGLKRPDAFESTSKAYEAAIVNLAGSLPLPSFWYQNHHWRIYYDEQLQKHRKFNDKYSQSFAWEDSREDTRILQIQSDDVILALTDAGNNILSFALETPKRIHAVDLNPTQNHLLELKVAAFQALDYADVWKMFGEGKHENFRALLIDKLSPYLSSYALQFWLSRGPTIFGGQGLFHSGGSLHVSTSGRSAEGKSPRPDYLEATSHVKLSHANAFDGLRIHTDEIEEVIAEMSPGTLTIAVVMDSMDRFSPEGTEVETQIRALNKALVPSGRVLLRSVGLKPWYISKFEELGFQSKCHGSRESGTCWICTKVRELDGVS